jgi:hypothetical protein
LCDLLRTTTVENFILDDENAIGSPRPSENIRMNILGGFVVKLSGLIGAGLPTTAIRLVGSGSGTARMTCDGTVQTAGGPALSVLDGAAIPIECGPSFFFTPTTQLVDRAGKARLYDGAYPAGVNIAAGTPQTLNYSGGNRVVGPGAVLAANTTIVLADNHEPESKVWAFDVDAQGFTLSFTNGGPSGGTIRTLPVGFSGLVKFVKNNNFDWVRCVA